MRKHRHFTVESTPAPADASQKDWCPFEDEGDVDLPDRSFVREDLRAEKARDDEISQRHFDEGWRLTNEMPDLVENGWRARAVYAEHGHQLALRQWGELSTRVSDWQETARSLEKQLEAARRASQAAPAPSDGLREALDYVLQDDLHNRLTPRVVDIAYSAFMLGAIGKNSEDGGPCDWFNDTKPMVMMQIGKIRAALIDCSANETCSPLTDRQLRDQITGGDR